jgi:hypothetical protein
MLAGNIAVYENIWQNAKETIDTIEKVTNDKESNVTFSKALTFAEEKNVAITAQRTNMSLNLSQSATVNENMRKINNLYFELVFAAAQGYKQLNNIEEEIFFSEGFQLLKYQTGQEYEAHYDGGTQTRRVFSPILYLNDDYEGGEIEFVNFDLKIKPTKETLYIFPANFAYRHIAHPVTDGTKYAIVTFIHDCQ